MGSLVGSNIAHYVLQRQIGVGGMGSVFEALHEQTGARVAIKILHPEFARHREALTRFFNESVVKIPRREIEVS